MKTLHSVARSDMGNTKFLYKLNEGGEEIVVDNNKKRLEILTLLKKIETLYLDPKNFRENQYNVIKETFEDAKAYFNEYKGDMSLVLEKLAEERQKAGKPMPEWLKGEEAVEEYKETVGALDNFQDAWSLAIDFKNIVAELKRDEEKREKASKGEVKNASEEVKEKVKTIMVEVPEDPQERMKFLKEQYEIAQIEARENNEFAAKEIIELIEKIEPLSLSFYQTSYSYQKKIENIKEIVNTYSGDFSHILEDIAFLWHKDSNPYFKDIVLGDYRASQSPLKGEALIKEFKKYIDEISSTQDEQKASNSSYYFINVLEKLEKQKEIDE